MDQIPAELIGAIGNLGIGGLFLWLFFIERKNTKEVNQQKEDLHNKVLEAFNRNTEVSAETNAQLERNAEASKTLSELVYEVLKERRNK